MIKTGFIIYSHKELLAREYEQGVDVVGGR